MKTKLRLAILDHPKKLLTEPDVQRVLSDSVVTRQMGFERTIETYLTADKYDMIATHFLVYDASQIYSPKALTGIRLVYNDRCRHYGLVPPLDENIKYATKDVQSEYWSFKETHPNLPECIGWFVDSNSSFAKTSVDLPNLLFFAITVFLMRQGISYFTGATNERYKGSRWVSKVGPFKDGFEFMHPTIPYIHKVTSVERFHIPWLQENLEKYGEILLDAHEMVPHSTELSSIEKVFEEILQFKSRAAS